MKIITKKGKNLSSIQADRILKKLPESNKYESFLISGFPEKNKAYKKLSSYLKKHSSWTILYYSVNRLPLSAYYSFSLTIVKRIPIDFIGNKFQMDELEIDDLFL